MFFGHEFGGHLKIPAPKSTGELPKSKHFQQFFWVLHFETSPISDSEKVVGTQITRNSAQERLLGTSD